MSQQNLLILSAVLVVLSLGIAAIAWMSSMRWVREYRASTEQAVRAKDQAMQAREDQLASDKEAMESLKKEVAFLKELDSVRFEVTAADERRIHRVRLRLPEALKEESPKGERPAPGGG